MAAGISVLAGAKGHVHLPQFPALEGVAERVVCLPIGATHFLPDLSLTFITPFCGALGNDDVIFYVSCLRTSFLEGFISNPVCY